MAIFGRLATYRFKMKRKERKEKQIKIKGDKPNKREGEENRITYYFNTQLLILQVIQANSTFSGFRI